MKLITVDNFYILQIPGGKINISGIMTKHARKPWIKLLDYIAPNRNRNYLLLISRIIIIINTLCKTRGPNELL